MKKILSLALALTLVFAMAIPAMAENETGGSTALKYEVASSYTITIPTAVTITGGTGTQAVSVNAGSVISADKSLQFKITAATNYDTQNSKFRMKNNVGTDVYLAYTITTPGSPDPINVEKDAAFFTASPAEAYTGKSVTLTYTPETAQSAGSYTDSLTFTVGLAP